MSCIVVTGGAGFIGRSLIPYLALKGYEISSLDIYTAPLEDLAKKYGERIKLVQGDSSEITDLLSAVEICSSKPIGIIHMAAILSAEAERNPWKAFKFDVMSTAAVLEISRLMRIPKVIFTSSIAAYGASFSGAVSEDMWLPPKSFYGVSKVFGELWGLRYCERFGLMFRALRLPAVIGPGRRGGGVSAYASMMIENAVMGKPYIVYVDKEVKIPLIYVDDAVRAITIAFETPGASGIYNISGISPSPTAWEIYEALRKRRHRVEIEFKPDPLMTSIARSWPEQLNDEKARRELGWSPSFNTIDKVIDAFIERLARDKNF
jgi:threonine 3-dehydrogenase